MLTQIIKKIPWWKLAKFVITGGAALAIDVAVYYGLTRYGGMYYLLARTFSLGVAVIWSFNINRYWTFQAADGKITQQAPRFIVVIITTSLISLGLMKVGVSFLGQHDLFVILCVAIITTLFNFSAHFFWSYAKSIESEI